MKFSILAFILNACLTASPVLAQPVPATTPPHRAAGPVSFVGEEIGLVVTGNRVAVTGQYHLHSDLPGKHAVPLAYPFPAGPKTDYPDTVRIYRGKELSPVQFEEDRKQSAVFFRIEAEGDFEFTAVYSQRLRAREATYILTTTREWGAPLQTAVFRITLPNNLVPVYWSWLPDHTERSKEFTTYSIHRTSFFPDRDLTVRWKPRKGR